MSKYVHLISTQSPIEMDQILFSLKRDGVDCRSVGENALSAGNTELSGINGGSIEVRADHMDKAQKVLENLGLDSKDKEGDNSILKYGLIFLAVIFGILILIAILAL